ncbi:MAG: YdcF family protein [Pseudomonadales bacterium]|nr:YdcF family protein [Pseudomonadales bacterium]
MKIFTAGSITVAVLLAIVLLSNEAAYRLEAASPGLVPGCTVLVLGYPAKPDGSADAVQKFRVDTAIHRYQVSGCTRFILSGGAVANRFEESDVMRSWAIERGVEPDRLVIEPRARSTWENIACSTPLVPASSPLIIVSDSLHALRGKRYFCRQNPERCQLAAAAGANPPIELFLWKQAAAINEYYVRIRDYLVYEGKPGGDTGTCPEAGD